MAVVTYTISQTQHPEVFVVSWLALAKGDTGTPLDVSKVRAAGGADRSIQIGGTFDSATVTLEGSNDGTNYITLTDPQGNAISKTAAALESITEFVKLIRPAVAGSGGTAAVNFYLTIKGSR